MQPSGDPKIGPPSTKTRSVTFFRPNFTGHAVAGRSEDGERIVIDCLCSGGFSSSLFSCHIYGAAPYWSPLGFAAVQYQYNAGPSGVPMFAYATYKELEIRGKYHVDFFFLRTDGRVTPAALVSCQNSRSGWT